MAKIVQIKQQAQTLPDIAERWGGSDMTVIAVVSLSKDTGKTAFAAHIAVQADRAGGGPVAMLDFSAGGDLVHWKQQRGKPLPEVRQSQLGRVRDDILRLEHERLYSLCILDLMAPDAAGTTHALATTQLAVVLSPPEGEVLDKATVLVENIAAMGVPDRTGFLAAPAHLYNRTRKRQIGQCNKCQAGHPEKRGLVRRDGIAGRGYGTSPWRGQHHYRKPPRLPRRARHCGTVGELAETLATELTPSPLPRRFVA